MKAAWCHWGACPDCPSCDEPDSLEEVVESAGLTYPDDWDAFVAVMTDQEASQAEKANWMRWMDHYLDCHTQWVCPETPAQICPDDDPYGFPAH